jgi:hypothetical protein
MDRFLIPRSEAVAAVLLIALVTAASTADQFSWEPSSWTTASASLRQSVLPTAPILATWAAWTARIRQTAACGPVPARGYGAIVRRQLGVLLLCAEAGLLLGLAPVVIRTAVRATVGGPDYLVLLSGAVEQASWVTIGYLVGAVVAYPYSLAAVGLGTVVVLVLMPGVGVELAGSSRPYYFAVVPRWNTEPGVGWHETPAVAVFRVALGCALAVGAWLFTTSLDRPLRRRGAVDRARAATVAFAAPLLLFAGGAAVNPVPWAADEPLETECRDVGDVRLCLPAEVEGFFPQLLSGFQSVVAASGTGGFTGDMGPHDLVNFPRGVSQDQAVEGFAYNVAWHLSGVGQECMQSTDGTDSEASTAAAYVMQELARRASQPSSAATGDPDTPQGRMALLSDETMRDWFTRNGPALRACELSLSDLP